ncbi:thiamine kinase-like enzyme [Lentzea atacamensis]|uniref:Thiamine kinase-like enzyme n=1 Tax=Lentzea atacamensis TaxID=531938 RepID=A0ABX9DXW4_9PSEU|nr:phosphotransferase [Lentzea atacamensis]RAS59563.1 thiamine kinase-like enzyme [Lentzea atacamensis]
MTASVQVDVLAALHRACVQLGLSELDHEPVRISENSIFRLPGGVIARVSKQGQTAAAAKEVALARWLAAAGVPAVRVIETVDQPVVHFERAVTFWHELAPHRPGEPGQIASALRRLHSLPVPDFAVPALDPFVRLAERIGGSTSFTPADRDWLRSRLAELESAYRHGLPPGLAHCVVHGDAWRGNVVATDDGEVVLLDLERMAVGPPEWDLVSTAIKYTSFGFITAQDYQDFVDGYGHDVTAWEGFELLRDVRELRMTTMAGQLAATDSTFAGQAAHRLSCLRGEAGPRPWPGWVAVP